MINAIFHLSPSLMQTLLYSYLKSILVKIEALLSDLIKSAILGIGQQFFDSAMPDSYLGNKSDIFHYIHENNQLKKQVQPPRDVFQMSSCGLEYTT